MTLPLLQHVGEAAPCLRCRMLATELALAVSPTAAGDHGGHPPVRAACEHGHGRAEAASHQADALGVDFGAGGEVGQRIACIRHLIETDDSPALAFAVAASSKVDAHRHIAPLGKLLGHNALPVTVLVAAEAVQHDKRRSALTGTEVVRSMHDTG